MKDDVSVWYYAFCGTYTWNVLNEHRGIHVEFLPDDDFDNYTITVVVGGVAEYGCVPTFPRGQVGVPFRGMGRC
jgi:hypothetical protein